MTTFITYKDITQDGDNCVSIRGISFGCKFIEDGCKRNYVLHNCMFADSNSKGIYTGNISLRFNEDKSCQSALIDTDSLTEICTGQPPAELDGLNWVGLLQPDVHARRFPG